MTWRKCWDCGNRFRSEGEKYCPTCTRWQIRQQRRESLPPAKTSRVRASAPVKPSSQSDNTGTMRVGGTLADARTRHPSQGEGGRQSSFEVGRQAGSTQPESSGPSFPCFYHRTPDKYSCERCIEIDEQVRELQEVFDW